MKKIAYTFGFTLLCNIQAQAQEVLPINDEAAAAISVAVDELAQIASQTENEQTIFFEDDMQEELKEEAKHPVLTPQEIKKEIPLNKISETASSPQEIKQSEEQEPIEQKSTEIVIPESNIKENTTSDEQQETKDNNGLQEEATVQEFQNSPEAELAPLEAPSIPQSIDIKPQTNEIITEKETNIDISNTIEINSIPEISSEELDNNKNIVNEADEIPIIKESIPSRQPVETETQSQQNDLSVNEPKEAKTEIEESSDIKSNEESSDKINDVDSADVFQQQETSAEKPIKEKPKSNAFTLDMSAALPSNILKNDALSPSVLNRSIVNISPEQRAKMMMKKKYDEMDANQDGVISEKEFVDYKTKEANKIAHQVFKQIDKNDNKQLSEYEYGLLMQRMIESYITPQTQAKEKK